jgi:endo-1,4-beta-xylanase
MKNNFLKFNGRPNTFGFEFLLLAALFPLSSACSTTQTVTGSTLTNGLQADAPFYEIVDMPLEKRQKVIKIIGADTKWAVVKYSLAEYRGKEITIQLSADVKREGAGGNLLWQVNNSDYPSVAYLDNAPPGVWHHIKGRRIITPTDNDPVLYLTNWENNAEKTIYYIDNFTITIEVGNSLSPDLSLPSLKSAYKNDFLIGNIVDNTYISGKYFDLLKHHFNILTTTETYPVQLAPSVKGGAYQWTRADTVVDFARSNGILMHGHILTWHEATPAWLTNGTREEVEQNLKDYITTVLTHFKGKFISWDVVNEAMQNELSAAAAAGDWKKCVFNSQNPWYDKLGADYIEIAFRTARAVDPDIKLYYNDYFHLDAFYSWDSVSSAINKVEAVRRMVDDINTRYKKETGGSRNLIEGVGIQSHHYGFGINLNNLRSCLDKFITLGVEIAISELDVSTIGYVRGPGNDTAMTNKDEIAQARLYARLFSLYREYAAYISRVTWWGMDDGGSWLSAGNPCLFDWKLNAKKAFYAVCDPDVFLAEYGK